MKAVLMTGIGGPEVLRIFLREDLLTSPSPWLYFGNPCCAPLHHPVER